MFKKFTDLSKGKKVGVIGLTVVLFGAIGFGIGAMMVDNVEEAPVIINKEVLAQLIETEYDIVDLKNGDTDLVFSVTGDLTKDDVKTMAQNLIEKAELSGWEKETMKVNVFAKGAEDTDTEDKFYVEGLMHTATVDVEKSVIDLSSYESVPKVEKTDSLVDYGNGSVESKDGHLIISLDMDLPEDEESLVEVAQQAKTFSVLFRDANSDKDIDSVELKLNPNDDTKKFAYHTDYETILLVTDVIPY